MDTRSRPILYPYDEEFGAETVFRTDYRGTDFYDYITGMTDDFDILIKREDRNDLGDREKEQIETLKLLELYAQHKDYVMSIRRKEWLLNRDAVNDLQKRFPILFSSLNPSMIKDIMLMNYLDFDSLGQRPFSKLTRDVLEEDFTLE